MTTRKSQLEKFDAKWGKQAADTAMLKREAAKKAIELEEDYMAKGEKIMEKVTKGTEEVFAVIARSGMETFIKTWNNSMENVIRETIRTEVRSMIQEEMQAAMKGMFAGMNDAMVGMMGLTQSAPSEEPAELDLTNVMPMDELIKR